MRNSGPGYTRRRDSDRAKRNESGNQCEKNPAAFTPWDKGTNFQQKPSYSLSSGSFCFRARKTIRPRVKS